TGRYPENVQPLRAESVKSYSSQVEALIDAHAQYAQALETLKKSPEDTEANRTVGRYEYFIKHDRMGLERLRRIKDEVSELLHREEKQQQDAALLITLGDAWMDLA